MSAPAAKKRKTLTAPPAPPPPLPPTPTPPPAPPHSASSNGVNTADSTSSSSSSSSTASATADVESLFLAMAEREGGSGITYTQFLASNPTIPVTLLLPAINNLLSRGRLLLLSDPTTTPPTHYYKHITAQAASAMHGLSATDLVVYQLIAKEGNRGLWVRDIRRHSGVGAVEVGKVLKLLMARRLVKCEKSIEGNNKKVYMLWELEPAKEVRGNSWYGNGEFDKDFIDALRQTSMQFIRQRSQQQPPAAAAEGAAVVVGVTAEEVSAFLKSTGVFEVECTLEEMGMILDGLVFDGLLTSSTAAAAAELGLVGRKGKQLRYVLQRGGRYETPLVQIPCVLCPVRSQCSEEPGSVISPYTCEYYSKWLEF